MYSPQDGNAHLGRFTVDPKYTDFIGELYLLLRILIALEHRRLRVLSHLLPPWNPLVIHQELVDGPWWIVKSYCKLFICLNDELIAILIPPNECYLDLQIFRAQTFSLPCQILIGLFNLPPILEWHTRTFHTIPHRISYTLNSNIMVNVSDGEPEPHRVITEQSLDESFASLIRSGHGRCHVRTEPQTTRACLRLPSVTLESEISL